MLARFARRLREERLAVGSDRVLAFARAAALLPPGDVYWAGRATLVARADEIAVYDSVVAEFFGGEESPEPATEREATRHGVTATVADAHGGASDRATLAGWASSSVERLREKRFAHFSDDELAEIARLTARIRPGRPDAPHSAPPARPARQLRRSPHGTAVDADGGRPDRARASRAPLAATSARPPPRRLGLDAAVLTRAPPLRARGAAFRPPTGRRSASDG
jgi:uncharacterized protein with von Willebrand factor type A (vWA) domain